MDTNDLVKQARSRFDHAAAKRVLKEKYEAKMLFAQSGGMWRAGPELLNILKMYTGTIVLLDLYENPVKVDAVELYNTASQHWQEQMNAWLIEYEQQTQQR